MDARKQYTDAQKAEYYKRKLQRQRKAVKKANPQQFRKVQKRIPREIRAHTMKPNISDCAQRYIASLVNPFDESLKPCVPSFFPLPSQKVSVWVRSNFALGTTGHGYVICRPTADNDVNISTIHTTSTSVGTNSTVLNSFTNLTTQIMTKNPYPDTEFSTLNRIQARVVSYGLRVRYIGTEDNRNGVVTTIETLERENLNTLTFSQINNFQHATKCVPNSARDWITVAYSGPSQPQDIEFQSVSLPLGSNYPIGAIIVGNAGDTYDYEFWVNLEFAGRNAQGKTASHVDQKGFDVAVAEIKEMANKKSLEVTDAPGIFDRFVNKMSDVGPALIEGGKRMLGIMDMDPSSVLRTALSFITSHGGGLNSMLSSGPPQHLLRY